MQSEMSRMKRKCYGFFAIISRFNLCRVLLLGTLENIMYATKPLTLEELRDKIELAINDIPLAIIQMVCCFVQCWDCTVAEGGHFEHA